MYCTRLVETIGRFGFVNGAFVCTAAARSEGGDQERVSGEGEGSGESFKEHSCLWVLDNQPGSNAGMFLLWVPWVSGRLVLPIFLILPYGCE